MDFGVIHTKVDRLLGLSSTGIAMLFMRLGIVGNHGLRNCPVANYLSDGDKVSVGNTYIIPLDSEGREIQGAAINILSSSINRFVCDFDRGYYPFLVAGSYSSSHGPSINRSILEVSL